MDEKGSRIVEQKILEAKMTAQPRTAEPESYVIFKIIAKNVGDSQLCNVSVRDELPKGMRYISDSLCGKLSDDVVLWQNLDPILPGEKMIIELTAYVDGSTEGNWLNRAIISSVPENGITLNAPCSFKVCHKKKKQTLYAKERRKLTGGTHLYSNGGGGSTSGTHKYQ